MRRTLRSGEGLLGAVVLVAVAFVIVAGPWLAPFSPTRPAVGAPLQGPSASHLLGTDDFGRDVLSRVLTGGRDVVAVPLAGTLLALLVGGVLGIMAAYRGGVFDTTFTRATDLGLSLPPLLLVLVIIAGVGGSSAVLVLAVAIVFAPRIGRVARGAAQAVVANDYISIARLRGENAFSIAVREILPNVTGALMVEFAVRFTYAILFVAALNFLGVGAQPPSSNWGLMIAQGRDYVGISPWAVIAPAAAICLLSISLNLLADAAGRVLARDVHEAGGIF